MDPTALVARMGSADGERHRRRRRRRRRRSNAELTEDLIVDILARLPVKSLLRFKSVCKLWYSLIVSPNFIAMHSTHSHSKKNVSLLCYSCKANTPTKGTEPPIFDVSFRFGDVPDVLSFLGRVSDVEIVGCFNGVVCLSLSRHGRECILWNPATRQVRHSRCDQFFPRTYGMFGSGFCFHPVTNAFRVTQMKLIAAEGETRAQVIMFSTATNSWTKKTIGVPYQIQIMGSILFQSTICVDRYIYWQISNKHPGDIEDRYILSYDVIDEVFKLIEMPFSPFTCYARLTYYKGSLAMFVHKQELPYTHYSIFTSYDEVEVWVMNDCDGANQSWSKLLTCRPSFKVEHAVGFFRRDNVDFVILRKHPDRLLNLYDPETGETKRFWETKYESETFLYSESLVSLN